MTRKLFCAMLAIFMLIGIFTFSVAAQEDSAKFTATPPSVTTHGDEDLIPGRFGMTTWSTRSIAANYPNNAPADVDTVEEKVDWIAGKCREAGMTEEWDIALWLHDWLIYNANYDYTYSIYRPEGVLLNGTGVCQSYAEAYELLLDEFGIENTLLSAFEMNHAWNLVKIDGEWCHVDCTWDDPNEGGGYENHNYFGMTDKMIGADHVWNKNSYVACTSKINYYPIRMGYLVCETEEEFYAILNEQAALRNEQIDIYYIGGDPYFSMAEYFYDWYSNNYSKYQIGGWGYIDYGAMLSLSVSYWGGHTHSYSETVTAPTCTDDGYTEYYCNCGAGYRSDYVDALGHDWSTWLFDQTGSCTENTVKHRDCLRCSVFETEVIVAPGHIYDAIVTAPTCTEAGYTTYTCACGDAYTDDYVDATGHYVLRPGMGYVDAYTLHNSATDPFVLTDGWYASTNKYHNSSSTFQISAKYDCTMVLKYKVSSEQYYDILEILVNGNIEVVASGEISETSITLDLTAGDVVSVTYSKDISVSAGSDTGYFKIDSCTQAEEETLLQIPTEEAEPTCTEAVICESCNLTIKEALGHSWNNTSCSAPKTCTVCGATEGVAAHTFINGVCTGCGAIQISETTFPDANFRAYITDQTYGADGVLTTDELLSVTEIYVSEKNISDLTGIQYFTALERLSCDNNQLTSLDVSKNTALTSLHCWNNQLTRLDVTKNTALTHLYCRVNKLTSLDVTKNTALTYLDCANNQLTSLDVTKNIALEYLFCYANQLTSLDMTKNTALTQLSCDNNQLTSLDVSKNTALTELSCGSNQLTGLDVTKNTALDWLSCDSNQLTALDVTKNIALEYLFCYANQLTSLDVTKNTALTYLNCSINQLTSLDVTKNTALTQLSCGSNQLTSLDVTKNTALTHLYCYGNNLTSLDVTKNTALTYLNCSINQLTSLDVTKNIALTELYCYNNQRTISVIQNRYDLSDLAADGFDISKASNWQGGTVSGNVLTVTSDTVTYTYDLGNGETETFTLIIDGTCDHIFVEKADEQYLVSAADCTAAAVYHKSCSGCGAVSEDTFGYGAPLGHTGGTATCKDPAACTRCEQPYGELDNSNHVGGTEIRDAVSATCTVDGYTGDTWCLGCQRKIAEGETLTAPGHNYSSVVTDPTCTEQGYTTHTCECGDSYVDTYVDALGHDMSAWETVAEATCTEDGSKRRDCKRCDYYETEVIKAPGHNHESVVTAPTCTENGYTTHTCECGDSYVDTYVDALDHKWDDGVVTKEPTEDAEGVKTYTCQRCPETKTEPIPKLDHVHVYTSVVTDPTCTEQGYTTHTCKCGDSYVDTYVDALGHDMGEWTVTKEATCTEDGEKRRDCERCDHFETETIEAIGHKYEAVVTVPTCTEQGYTTYTCSVCGDSYVDDYVAATEHNYVDGICSVCGNKELLASGTCGENLTWTLDTDCELIISGTGAMTNYTYSSLAPWRNYMIRSVRIEDGVTAIGRMAFMGCSGVTSVEIADSVTDIGALAFSSCSNLESISIPAGVTVIDEDTFRGCRSLKNIEISGKITEIGYGAFYGCSSLTSITIPDSVTGIGDHAFSYCDSLQAVYYGSTAEQWAALGNPVPETVLIHYSCANPADHWQTAVIEATCEANGWTSEGCACGYERNKVITEDALGHNWGNWLYETMGNCTVDSVKRRDCLRCGDFERENVAAPGHDYEDVVTPPTVTEQGYTTHTCSFCGDSYVDSYTDPLLVPEADVAVSRMILGNELAMQFAFPKADIVEGVEYVVSVTKTYADGKADKTILVPQSEWKTSGAYYYVSFDGIAAKEMGDEIKVQIQTAEGIAVGDVYTDSVKDYAIRQLRKTTDAKTRTLYVDMLNYGAATQTYFGYAAGDLVTDELTETERSYGTESVQLENNLVKGTGYVASQLDLGSSILLRVKFNGINSGMRAVVSFTSHTGAEKKVEISGDQFISGGTVVVINQVVAADYNQDVTITVYDGDKEVANAVESVASYLSRQLAKDNPLAIYDAVAKYCAAAYAYLHK